MVKVNPLQDKEFDYSGKRLRGGRFHNQKQDRFLTQTYRLSGDPNRGSSSIDDDLTFGARLSRSLK